MRQWKQLYSGQRKGASTWPHYHFWYDPNTAQMNSILRENYLKLFYAWSKFCTFQFERQVKRYFFQPLYLFICNTSDTSLYVLRSLRSLCNSKDISLQVYLQIDPVGQPASYPTCCVYKERSLFPGGKVPRVKLPTHLYFTVYLNGTIVTTFTCLIHASF